MKKMLTNNIGLKLLAVFAASLLWLIVVNIDDPVITKTFTGIPVTIINDEAITENGKVYTILEGSDTVSYTVRGNRKVVDGLRSTDFVAVADMEELIFLDTVPITITPTKNADKIDSVSQTQTLKVSIEDADTKQFPVTVVTYGTPAEGYAVGETKASPNSIKITGPVSVVKKVSQVKVELDVSNMNGNMEVQLQPKLYDSDGENVDAARITFSNDGITVNMNMLRTKNVDLSFETEGTPEDGYEFVGISYEPTTVTIAGTRTALAEISTIDVPKEAVNIDGATGDIEVVVDIREYLPETVRLTDESYASVLVTVKIEKLTSKTLELPQTSIAILNLPEGLNMSYADAAPAKITVRGLGADMELLTIEQITAQLDLDNLAAGSHSVPLKIKVPEKYEVIGEAAMNIILSAPEEVPETTEEVQ